MPEESTPQAVFGTGRADEYLSSLVSSSRWVSSSKRRAARRTTARRRSCYQDWFDGSIVEEDNCIEQDGGDYDEDEDLNEEDGKN
jgi:hypothetical protein